MTRNSTNSASLSDQSHEAQRGRIGSTLGFQGAKSSTTENALQPLEHIIRTDIKDIHRSFASCIEIWGGSNRESTLRPTISNAFNEVAQESGFDEQAFENRLSELNVSLIDIEKIKLIATACFAFPKIHYFFRDTAPTQHLGRKIQGVLISQKATCKSIRKAFLKTCLGNTSDFEDALNAAVDSLDISLKMQEHLRAYLRFCGILERPKSSSQAVSSSSSSGPAASSSSFPPKDESRESHSSAHPDPSHKREYPLSEAAPAASSSAAPPQKERAYVFPFKLTIPESFFDDCQALVSKIEKEHHTEEGEHCVTQITEWLIDLKKENAYKLQDATVIELQRFLEKVRELREREGKKPSSAARAATTGSGAPQSQLLDKIDTLEKVIKKAIKDIMDIVM